MISGLPLFELTVKETTKESEDVTYLKSEPVELWLYKDYLKTTHTVVRSQANPL